MKDAQIYIDEALSGLKDFQLATVDYVMRQFFEDDRNKLLIADEVGLGKTIVSRGVVAKMYQRHMSLHHIKQFTVIYICSNQAIAKQNIGKLNFLYGKDAEGVIDNTTEDDRLTALAYEPSTYSNPFHIRIKAFTPATSFDQNSQTGRSDERVLLFRLLTHHIQLADKKNSLKWLVKGDGRMREDNWDKVITDAERFEDGKDQKHYHIGRYRPLRADVRNKFFKKLESKLPFKNFKAIYEIIDKQEAESIINVLTSLCTFKIQKNNYRKWTKDIRWRIS